MPSPNERRRNNVRAGIFVTIAIVLAVTSVILLTDVVESIRRPMAEYTVSFEVIEGVKNHKAGADVRIGGVSMGRVKAVEARLEGETPFEVIDVTFGFAPGESTEHVRCRRCGRVATRKGR